MNTRTRTWRTVLGLSVIVACGTPAVSHADTLTQWAVPFPDSQPFKVIAAGTDVFYLDNGFEQHLGQLDVAGNRFTQWLLPYIATSPSDIARQAADGTIFMSGANQRFETGDTPPGEIGQFDPTTQLLRRWPVADPGSGPWAISIDDQGAIMFRASDLLSSRSIVGRLDTVTGAVTTWAIPDGIADQTAGDLLSIPGGSVFFNTIDKVVVLDTVTGVVTAWFTSSQPAYSLAADAAGNLYFQELSSSFTGIARLVPQTGQLTEWATPGAFNDDLTYAFGRLFFGSIAPTGLAALNPAAPGTESVLSPAFVDTIVPITTVVTPSAMTLSRQQAPGLTTQREIQRHHSGAFAGWAIPSSPRGVAAGPAATYFAASATNTIGRITR
jgi:hypothetical protein